MDFFYSFKNFLSDAKSYRYTDTVANILLVVSCNQMAAITRQWCHRLVNVYEVKTGMVCLHFAV